MTADIVYMRYKKLFGVNRLPRKLFLKVNEYEFIYNGTGRYTILRILEFCV